MLPPAMDVSNNNQSLETQQQHYEQQQQQQHHQTALFLNATNTSSASASISKTNTTVNITSAASSSSPLSSPSTTSSPSVLFNTSSIKNFLNKTLANVTKTNLSDYTAQHSSNSTHSHALVGEVYDGLVRGTSLGGGEGISHLDGAIGTGMVSSLSNGTHHLETTTAFPTAQTVATFIAGNKNRATTIIVYPTVSPESIVIPIVSCIFGFPILAFIVICCLRHRAKLARERDRRRNYDMQDHAVSLVRFSPIHRLNYRSSRAISLRPERSLSQGFTSLELDTVVEERCSDIEQTQTEIIHPESPMESSTTSYKMSFSSS